VVYSQAQIRDERKKNIDNNKNNNNVTDNQGLIDNVSGANAL